MINLTEKDKNLTIMKFGGSCLEDSRSYSQTMEIIKNYYGKSKVVIVASAMKNITDKLIDFYNRS
ncbi:MAG: amino acid kinase family protein, partial [Promethearchaeota archaeon]